jgi:SAM-dependent methyltransferase
VIPSAQLGVSLKRLKDRLPSPLRSWLRRGRGAARRTSVILNGVTDWSVLRRLHPFRPDFGYHYGKCIDRYYIERFLAVNAEFIRGRVAEIGGDQYARHFGGNRVEQCDVIDIDESNHKRTVTLDLAQTAVAPGNLFDCILCIQTLFEIYDHAAAVASLRKMLRPGGVLLATLPGLSQRVPAPMLGGGGDWWRYTACSARRLFADAFGEGSVEVSTYGNVLAATAFLHGLVERELTREEIEFRDPDYEVLIGVKAVKSATRADYV